MADEQWYINEDGDGQRDAALSVAFEPGEAWPRGVAELGRSAPMLLGSLTRVFDDPPQVGPYCRLFPPDAAVGPGPPSERCSVWARLSCQGMRPNVPPDFALELRGEVRWSYYAVERWDELRAAIELRRTADGWDGPEDPIQAANVPHYMPSFSSLDHNQQSFGVRVDWFGPVRNVEDVLEAARAAHQLSVSASRGAAFDLLGYFDELAAEHWKDAEDLVAMKSADAARALACVAEELRAVRAAAGSPFQPEPAAEDVFALLRRGDPGREHARLTRRWPAARRWCERALDDGADPGQAAWAGLLVRAMATAVPSPFVRRLSTRRASGATGLRFARGFEMHEPLALARATMLEWEGEGAATDARVRRAIRLGGGLTPE